MPRPQLSIVIPAYNCGSSITTIVKSIGQQAFRNFELIIVDDKSTDNTAKVVADLAQHDQRIKLINQPQNGGAAIARNAGIKAARGQYLMFFDADDNIKPIAIQTFINTMALNQSIDLVVSGFTVKNLIKGKVISSVDVCTNTPPDQKANEPFRLYILRLLGLDGRLYQVWNKIYRTDIIKKNHLQFQPGINFGEDLVFNLDYLARIAGQIKFIPQALYIYNQSLDAGTFSKSSLVYANRQANYAELVKFVKPIPNKITKISLLSWIQYSWLYSHLLAINLSQLTHQQKLAKLRQLASQFNQPPLSNQSIIGRKRYLVEKMLRCLVRRPRLTMVVMTSMNFTKNNQLTAGIWRRLRQSINR